MLGVDAIFFYVSRDDWKLELATRGMFALKQTWQLEVDSMMFSMEVKLKNKDTFITRRHISKTITSGRYRFILPMFDERNI